MLTELERQILDAAEGVLKARGVYFYQRRPEGSVVVDSREREGLGKTLAEAVGAAAGEG